MATPESAEIEAVKIQLEAILEEQGKQIGELQQRMNQDTLHSKALESQLTEEREMWKGKEKLFSTKVKQLERELADLKNIMQHEAHPEKALLSRLNKDVAQKEQLITGLKSSLGKERSRNKELEQKLQQQWQQLGVTSPEQRKTKTRKELQKGNVAKQDKVEKEIGRASTSSGENVKFLEVKPVEDKEDDEKFEAVSVLFCDQQDSAEESESSPYLKENRRVGYLECRHCHKILVDRVMLPCCHGYCLQCIKMFILEDLKNGEKLIYCRFCGEKFTVDLQNCLEIPLALKRSVRNMAMKKKRPCEHCTRQRNRDIPDSEFFCIHCEWSICNECSHEHIQHSSESALHLILAIRSPIFRNELLEPELNVCDRHPDKPLDFYCDSCKLPICLNCFSRHSDHTLTLIVDYANAKKEKIRVMLSNMDEGGLYLARMSNSCKELEKGYQQKIWRIKENIVKHVDFMKYWLKKQAESLSRELDFITKLNDDGLQSLQNYFEDCLSELQQFRLYAEEFIGGAMPSHVACFGEDLCERARELADSAVEKKSFLENLGVCKGDQLFQPVTVSFAPNKPKPMSDTTHFFGALKIKTVQGWMAAKLNPKLIDTIQCSVVNTESKEVAGLTTLGDQLFIATRGNWSIEVYDLKTFEHKRSLLGMTNISDIMACTSNYCLYVYGCKGEFKGILKPDLESRLDSKEMWAMEYDAGRLSVTDECNIVITGCNTNKLSEYTPDGVLNLELRLEPETGVFHLWHALKTKSGYFIVSHGIVSDTVQGVCLVDRDGMVLRSYRDSCRAQLDTPIYLAFGERGCILVADLNNKRVLQLNAVLEFNEELISNKEGLQWPCRIHLDILTGKLFVANSTFLETWEVLIFDTKGELSPTGITSEKVETYTKYID